MATIRDVANLAGFSIATVSRALSKPETVTEATRQRVMESIDALGYEPNFAAKSLRKAKVSKILITVPDISNPFFANVIRGAEDAAIVAGYSIVLGNTRHDEGRELQYGSMLRRREVDGLIFLGHQLPPNVAQMLKSREDAPIVNGCEYNPDLPVTSVHIDNRRAAMDAMEYLYALGHREIGVITGPLESPLSRDRLEGVREAAASIDMSASLRVSVGDFSVDSGEREARALLTAMKRPTALFCFSDEMAMGALSAIRSIGLDCPANVSLIGFDDIRFARVVHPSLSTISQPADGIGRESVRLLLEILEGRSTTKTSITLRHQLIIRASTRALAQTVV